MASCSSRAAADIAAATEPISWSRRWWPPRRTRWPATAEPPNDWAAAGLVAKVAPTTGWSEVAAATAQKRAAFG